MATAKLKKVLEQERQEGGEGHVNDFESFSKLVHARFKELSKHELFITGKGAEDSIVEHYLAAFPEGANPIYLTNTEHDCSCCKHFLRAVGRVVAIIDGKMHSVWDLPTATYPYNEVAEALNEHILRAPIVRLFRTKERSYGNLFNLQELEDGTVKRWHHFRGDIAARHYTEEVGAQQGRYDTATKVFKRGLEELTASALNEVLDLIKENSLYRGEEHLAAVKAFNALHKAYAKIEGKQAQHIFRWEHAMDPSALFRNTVIGSLVVALSDGEDLEGAVKAFESKVAPENYKRPTALITPRMVEDALKTIKELDLEPSLDRRFAKVSDVSINNVLWVDNGTKAQMKGAMENLLMAEAQKPVSSDKVQAEDISIEDFMGKVLDRTTSMELLVQGKHMNNFMSLTAPVHADSKQLFKWTNDFGWSYDGNITDSIKEKVKRAGGNVTNALMRVSLAWYNYDDLDIHVFEPNRNHIAFFNKCDKLDVDMNAGGGKTREPVENVSWSHDLRDGIYRVMVHQYARRETTNVGCTFEVECAGKIHELHYPNAVTGEVEIAHLHVKGGTLVKIETAPGITAAGVSKDKWGVKTETWSKVNMVMYSPNYWDENEMGNKHHFFILEGCATDEPTRGIYNEFLNSKLEKHRKVFEVLGNKTKCQPTKGQLSGLGFSSTRGDTVVVKVAGPKMNRILNVKF